MIATQAQKVVRVVDPGAIVDNASFTAQDIDTKGWDYASVYVYLGATDIAMAALKLQESDDDSTYTDIDGLNFATDGALPSATDDNQFFAFHVNLNGPRKRYLRLVATAGDGTTGTYLTAFAVLSRGEEAPYTAAGRGLAAELVA